MSGHQNWHDQQGPYSGPPQQRHHPNVVDPYAGPSPSFQQGPSYSNQSHMGPYPQAHLPPPVPRQPQQQPWAASGGSQDFGGPSPSNSNLRSSGPYPGGYDGPQSIGSTNSPMRQHGTHTSPYASTSPYAPPPPHGQPDQQIQHPGQRGAMPPQSQYDYPSHHGPGPGSYQQHPHHPSAQPQNQQQQQQGPPPQHHSQHPQQHWNAGPIPSVLQPHSIQGQPGPGANRGPGGPSSHLNDRPYGVPKQEDDMDDDDYDDAKGKGRAGDAAAGTNKGTSDFVKKLFSMLDDKAYESVVAWSPTGESFIVKDMNDFTKHVLPRNFRHSNFASFVRQLNKYDFHKVKNPEDGTGTGNVGEHVWEFEHPYFTRGREDLLENVKRKIPAKKKGGTKAGSLDADRDVSPSVSLPADPSGGDKPSSESYNDLRRQIAHLTANQDQMQNHILALTKQYQGVIGEMLTFQRNMVQQDQLMQNLIQYLMNVEQDRRVDGQPDSASSFLAQTGNAGGGTSNGSAFLAQGGGSYENASAGPHSVGSSGPSGTDAAGSTNAASSTRMSGMTTVASTAAPLSPKSVASPLDSNRKTPEISSQLASLRAPVADDGTSATSTSVGANDLQSTSLEQPQPNGIVPFQSKDADPQNTPSTGKSQAALSSARLRNRRPTFVPGWAVPPRVLLVDDDEVCRRLSSKFLQVFGCQIDYAVDGMSAVNKMNVEKYDLVLMDIVMPNLDGASATSIIRQFDPSTPIISMTSNSGPSELINYMSSGMTDMLPKPFTKEGLLNMLEKHLLHLKAQRMPRASLDSGAQQPAPSTAGGVVSNNPNSGATASNGTAIPNDSSGGEATGADGSLNPLAGMGFTDEEYVAMLQNLIAAGTGADDDGGLSSIADFMGGVSDGMGGLGGLLGSKENTPVRAGEMDGNGSKSPYAAAGVKRANEEGSMGTANGNGNSGRGTGHPLDPSANNNKRGRYNDIS